jgi:hypothetical protein
MESSLTVQIPKVKQNAVDLEALSRETGVPVEVLRTFAGISDPANEHLFTAQSARKAFAGVKVYQVGYLVRYSRIGEQNYFFSFDRASAEEYAVKHHGTVHIMLEQP